MTQSAPPAETSPSPEPITVSVRGRTYRVNRGFNDRYWGKINDGRWELETFEIFERFLKPGDTYLDIGTFIGPTVLYGSLIAAKVHAVDADPVSIEELKRNIALNDTARERVTVHHLALNDHDGTVAFGSPQGGGHSVSSLLFTKSETTWEIPGLTLESLIEKIDSPKIAFIKMDIEAAEYRVIPAAEKFLTHERPTLYLSLHFDYLMKDATGRNIWEGKGVLGRFWCKNVIRPWRRFTWTAKILRALRGYKHLYATNGEELLRMSLLFNRCDGLVATDLPWPDLPGSGAEE